MMGPVSAKSTVSASTGQLRGVAMTAPRALLFQSGGVHPSEITVGAGQCGGALSSSLRPVACQSPAVGAMAALPLVGQLRAPDAGPVSGRGFLCGVAA